MNPNCAIVRIRNLDDGDIHQVSLRVAHLVLSIAAATKQIHDDLVLRFHIGWLRGENPGIIALLQQILE
jgi:hypothetical protein